LIFHGNRRRTNKQKKQQNKKTKTKEEGLIQPDIMTFLAAAYTLFWLIIFLYVLKINKGNQEIAKRLDKLEKLEES